MPLCPNDGHFVVQADCRQFDFTVSFEDTILSSLPEALFLALFAIRVGYLVFSTKRQAVRLRGPLYYVKQALAFGFFATKLATAVLRLSASPAPFAISKAAHLLSLVVSALVPVVVYAEHAWTYRSSTLLSSYGLLLVLFDAARIRTYVFASLIDTRWFAPFIASFAIRTLLLVAESFNPVSIIADKTKVIPKEARSNVFSRYFVLWLVPLFWRGRHTKLTLQDLDEVDPSMQSGALHQRFTEVWEKERVKAKPSLLRASLQVFPLEFLATFPPGIVWVLATFAQPFILHDLLDFIESYQSGHGVEQPVSVGISLTCAYALVYIIIALAYSHTQIASVRLCVQFRGAVVSSIFSKSLVLHTASARDLGASSAYNLMSVDIERFVMALVEFPETWTAVFSITIGLWLLWKQVGLFFLVALGLLFVLFAGLPKLGDITDESMDRFSADSDKRVKTTASVINNVKSIKLSGYKAAVVEKIKALREVEVGSLRKYFRASGSALMIGNVLPVWLELLVYASYGGYIATHRHLGKTLDTNTIFTTLSILHILTDPLVNAAIGFPALYGAYVSLRRVQAFLVAEEIGVPSKHDTDEEDMPEKSLDEKHRDNAFNVHRPVKLTVTNGSVHWRTDTPNDEQPLLRDLNVTLEPGSLTMVVGRIGSGKSTFLYTLLSEIRLLSGSVTSDDSRITRAYCSQDAWITTSTVRANILMNRPFDSARYARVVSACGLREDFADWAAGDLTPTGARGGALSGGQRQRVALARALYADADLYLLDDVFSAIDARLERSIFESLFGAGGLLRGKTVVIAGHNVSNLAAADQILVLEDGTTVEQGHPSALLSNPQSRLARFVDQLQREKAAKSQEVAEVPAVAPEEDEDEDDSNDEDRKQEDEGRQDAKRWAVYRFWALHSGLWSTGLFVFIAIVLSGPYLLPQVVLQLWGKVNDSTPNRDAGVYIAALAGVTVGHSALFGLVMWFLYQRVTPRGAIGMHNAMLEGVIGTSISFFDAVPAGRVVNRFSQDLYIITVELPKYLFLFLSNSADLVVLLAYTIVASPWIAVSIPPLAVIYWTLARFYTTTSRQIRHLDLSAKSPLYQHFGEAFEGLMTIRAYNMQSWFFDKNINLLNESQKPFYLRFIAQAWLALYLNLIVMIVAVLLSAIAVALRHSVAIGFLGVALSNLVIISGTLNRILYFFASTETSIVAIERVQEYAKLTPENVSAAGSGKSARPAGWPAKGEVTFENVTIRYRPELDPALKGIDFSVKAGTKLAIVGRSGSGKSTLLLSLFRVMDPSSGKITIDGVNLRDVSADIVRESISIIPQDPFLFDATVRENLIPTFAGSVSVDDSRLWDILEKIQMKDVVAGLDGGLDHVISSDGERFSRGQRQLLCFARAILQNRGIIALDEATSSVDHESDQLIQKLIREELANRTVITIAHRIATILDYDEVMVLQSGEIVEKGLPKELAATPGSIFGSMAGHGGQTAEL